MSKRTFDWTGVEYQSPEYYRLWRKHNNEKSREYHRAWDKHQYMINPEREKARRNRYRLKYPERIKANRMVVYALKVGKLVKLPCEVCKSIKVIAHHYDYNQPLHVMWLCELHHKEWHRDNVVVDLIE